jgi:hypothetical protein
MNNFKIGDDIIVTANDGVNCIGKGSYGKVIEYNEDGKRESYKRENLLHIRYEEIFGANGKITFYRKGTSSAAAYNGCYYTNPKRMKLVRIDDWRKELE